MIIAPREQIIYYLLGKEELPVKTLHGWQIPSQNGPLDWVAMKVYREVWGGKRKKWSDCGTNSNTHLVCERMLLIFWKQ